MKKSALHRQSAAIPTLSTTAPSRQGEGVGENGQTNTAQAIGRPRTRRRGGQPGNRNAAKPVLALSTLRRRVRALTRRAKAAMALVP